MNEPIRNQESIATMQRIMMAEDMVVANENLREALREYFFPIMPELEKILDSSDTGIGIDVTEDFLERGFTECGYRLGLVRDYQEKPDNGTPRGEFDTKEFLPIIGFAVLNYLPNSDLANSGLSPYAELARLDINPVSHYRSNEVPRHGYVAYPENDVMCGSSNDPVYKLKMLAVGVILLKYRLMS
jgi:hypothetical protein